MTPQEALKTHRQILTTQSRTSRIEITNADSYNRTVKRTVAIESQTARVRFYDSAFNTPVESYYTPSRVYVFDHTTNERTTTTDPTWNLSDVGFQASNTIVRLLENLDISATETTQYNGVTAINYTVGGVADSPQTPATTADGYILLTERGHIAAFDITKGNEEFTRRTQLTVSKVGTARVSRPEWIS